MSFSSKDKVPRYKSPYTRSSESSSTAANKSSKRSPKRPRDDIFSAKESIRSSLEEHSAKLQEEIDLKEREQNLLRKSGSSKILSIEEHIRVLEKKKVELLDRIEQIALETKEFDNERATLARAISVKDQRISDLLTQAQRVSHEQAKNKRVETEDITFQYRTHESYVDMLGEREKLLDSFNTQIKKLENECQRSEEEIARLQGEIERRGPKIALMNRDNREVENKIQAHDQKLKTLKINEVELDSELKILLSQKAKLLGERDVMKAKMEEIKTDTHLALRQLLAAQKKMEIKLNSNIKAFACRVMGIVMKRYQLRHMAAVVKRIETYKFGKSSFLGGVAKLSGIVENVRRRYLQETLLDLHGKFLNYPKISQLNEEMLRIKTDRNLKFRTWVMWRQKAKLSYMKREHQINALSKMSRIINEYEKRAKYEFISIVQSYSLRNETRLMELHSLFMKKNIKECQRAFSKWLIFVQLTNQAQDRARCEASLTNIRFLSYFFNRLRDHAKRSRKAKYNLLRKNFEQWYSEYQTRRLDAGNEIKADEMIQLKERGMLNKTFLEWKTILLQSKSRKMWGNSKERTEEYQANVKNLEKFENADQKKVKKNCFRRMSMTLKQKMGHYLHLWNFNAKTQSRKIEIAINCINRVLDKSLRQNFKRWKIIAAYLTHQNAEREKERALYYTEQVENQLMEAGDWHGIHGVNKTAHHLFQLERIAQRHKRRIIFRFFRKFHDNATQINKKEKAYTRGFLKLHKLFLKSHRQFFTYTATEYLRDRKLLKLHNAFGERRVQLLKTNSLLAIKQNAEKMQAAKQTLRKYFKNKWKKALSKRFLSWAHKVNHLKHRDSKKTHEQLESMYRSRNVDLEKVVRTNQSSEVNALDYGKKVLAGKYTNIFNILINNIGTLKLTALRRWREHAKQLFYKRKASFFMEKWIVRFYCRHFFQNMVLHGDKFQLATGKDLLDSVLNQRKEFKMKIDEEKEKFEGLHLHQEAQIVELTSSRNELKISSKFIKNALAKKLHEDRNAKFLSEVFKAWTHTIKNEKKGFEILVQTASRKLLREVFETIYIRSHTLNKADLQKRLLYKLVSNMETAQKEISFKNWKRFAFLRRKESAQIKLAKTGKNLDIVKAYFDRIKESGVQKVTLGNQKKLLQKYFTLFVEGVSIVKSLKKGKDKLVEKFAGETKLSFFEHLFNALKYKKYTTNLVNNARRRQNFRISREVFSSWKDEVRRIKTFGRVILHYQKIFNARNSLYALHTLNDYKLAKRFATNQDKKFAVTTCVNFVNLLHTMTLKQSLSTLKQNIYERSIIRQRVKELFIRAQRSKTAPYLQKWRRKTRALVVVSASHNTGPLYEEKKQLNRQITFLENLADQEGYEKEDVEFFQAKEDVARFNLLQKGISRLMLNSNGMGVLTKALNSWKEFVVQRKRVKYYANLIGNYMRKSDIAMGFSVWRNAVIREKEAEEEFSKVELKRKLAEQKNQDFFLTNQIKEVDKIQTEMEMLVEKQQIELDIAKGLAVKNLCRVELIFQKRAFEVLKAHDHDIKSNWKVDKSEAAGDTILKMQREIKYLEAEYKGLGRENEMLRATSLQGLDIANAIKEISKERDRLSKELESKDMTVKRLVNENQNLSIRLATAQREAEELIRYAKEFLQPMSAKISARSNESNESPNNKNTVRSSNVLSKK